jgi:excisionase family DNA binding protein
MPEGLDGQTNTYLLHVKNLPAEFGVHPSTIRRAIHGGELEEVRLGTNGRHRVTHSALEAFLRVEPRQ